MIILLKHWPNIMLQNKKPQFILFFPNIHPGSLSWDSHSGSLCHIVISSHTGSLPQHSSRIIFLKHSSQTDMHDHSSNVYLLSEAPPHLIHNHSYQTHSGDTTWPKQSKMDIQYLKSCKLKIKSFLYWDMYIHLTYEQVW